MAVTADSPQGTRRSEEQGFRHVTRTWQRGVKFFFLFTTFIRIHWYTVPPTFQFTVWEGGFDLHCFFQMGILNMIQHFMHKY
jgi:hypothetical protein